MGKLLAENEREKPNESMMGEHDYGFGNNPPCVVNPETGKEFHVSVFFGHCALAF